MQHTRTTSADEMTSGRGTSYRYRFVPDVLALLALVLVGMLARPAGILADDWGLVALTVETPGLSPEQRAANWGAAIEDLTSPWLASELWGFYRPLSTVLHLAVIDVLGLWSPHAHWSNLLLHALVLLAVLSLQRAFAVPLGGRLVTAAFLVAHPALAEPLLWHGCLGTVGATCLGLLGFITLVRFALLREESPWMLGAGLAALFLALMCKEDAFVWWAGAALALLFRRKSAIGAIGTRGVSLALAAVLGVHLVLRLHATGQVVPFGGGKELPPLTGLADLVLTKIAIILSPGTRSSADVVAGLACLPLLLIVVGGAMRLVRGDRLARTVVGSFALAVSVTAIYRVGEDWSASRSIYSAVVLAGILLGVGFRGSTRLWGRALWTASLGAIVIGVPQFLHRVASYTKAGVESRHLQRELRSLGSIFPPPVVISDGRALFVIEFMPAAFEGVPFLLPGLVFPIVRGWDLSRTNPIIDLQVLYRETLPISPFSGDAEPARAARAVGARTLIYSGPGQPLTVSVLGGTAGSAPVPLVWRDGLHVLPSGLAIRPDSVEWIELRYTGTQVPEELEWIPSLPAPEDLELRASIQSVGEATGRAFVDLASNSVFWLTQHLGGIRGFRVHGGADEHQMSLVLHARRPSTTRELPELEQLDAPMLIESIVNGEWGPREGETLVLMTPGGPFRIRGAPTGAVDADVVLLRGELRRLLAIDPHLEVLAFLRQSVEGGPQRRSELRRFQLHR